MIKLTSLLNELIVKDLTTSSEDSRKYFLVHREKLFILDSNSKVDSIRKFLKGHPSIDPKDKYNPLKRNKRSKDYDVYELLSSVASMSPDIAVGEYYPEDKAMVVWSQAEIQPKTSLMVKKAAKQLGVDQITRYYSSPEDDTIEKTYRQKQLVGGIPKTVFHGTNSKELRSILTYGLAPGRGTIKYANQEIYHEKHIFVAADFLDAMYYAFHAVHEEPEKYENYPIVLELTIPDPNRIDPDFDADVSIQGDPYYDIRTHNPPDPTRMKGTGISREMGKWGYKGRIPATFIKWIYYYNNNDEKWHKSRPEIWKKLLDRYDWETIGYKLGLIRY